VTEKHKINSTWLKKMAMRSLRSKQEALQKQNKTLFARLFLHNGKTVKLHVRQMFHLGPLA